MQVLNNKEVKLEMRKRNILDEDKRRPEKQDKKKMKAGGCRFRDSPGSSFVF